MSEQEWEGADDLEQDLQDKIKIDMEPKEPKIEDSAEKEVGLTNDEWNEVLTALGSRNDMWAGRLLEEDSDKKDIQEAKDKTWKIYKKIEEKLSK